MKRSARRLAVHARGCGRCWLCGERVTLAAMTLDHVIPRALGGDDRVANLLPAHRACNQARGCQIPQVGRVIAATLTPRARSDVKQLILFYAMRVHERAPHVNEYGPRHAADCILGAPNQEDT